MPNYSVHVDDQLGHAVEQDRAMLSAQMGVQLSTSQYLRLVLTQRTRHAEPMPAGVAEGIKQGLAKFMYRMQGVASEIAAEAAEEAAATG